MPEPVMSHVERRISGRINAGFGGESAQPNASCATCLRRFGGEPGHAPEGSIGYNDLVLPSPEVSPAMTFNPGSQLDPGQISDRRGMGRGGVALGGGGAIGIIVLIAYTLLGGPTPGLSVADVVEALRL